MKFDEMRFKFSVLLADRNSNPRGISELQQQLTYIATLCRQSVDTFLKGQFTQKL